MNLRNQKKLAADILKVGISRVYINPETTEEIGKAITRDDIRYHIAVGNISAIPKKGISRGRHRKKIQQGKKGRQRGHGHRSGTKNAREPKKEAWMRKVRALRDELRKMKENKEIDDRIYRKAYRQIKGNLFHSRRHLREHVERMKAQ